MLRGVSVAGWLQSSHAVFSVLPVRSRVHAAWNTNAAVPKFLWAGCERLWSFAQRICVTMAWQCELWPFSEQWFMRWPHRM